MANLSDVKNHAEIDDMADEIYFNYAIGVSIRSHKQMNIEIASISVKKGLEQILVKIEPTTIQRIKELNINSCMSC